MRPGGGKQKGAQFEREICKRLSLWVSDGEREDVFWRSAMSGGRATVQHRKGVDVRQGGDICAVAPEGHILCDEFFIECKYVKDLGFGTFIVNGTGKLRDFWLKCLEESARHKKSPMLIAKQNGWPTIVIIKHNLSLGPCDPFLTVHGAGKGHPSSLDVYYFDDVVGS